MCKFLFVFPICVICLQAQAQRNITGLVHSERKQPFAGVTVSIHKPDSSLIKIALTDASGRFVFSDQDAATLLKLSAAGYTTQYCNLKTAGALDTPLVMQLLIKTMSTVQVQAVRPLYQYLPDRTILNTDAVPSNAGNNLLELLSKIPDVTVDPEGNISLNGQPGVLVMIDGRETFLSGPALLNMLRSMPAATTDQLEIISNPSAKYEAIATGGIINIKTKKNLAEGFNGNINIATGVAVYNNLQNRAGFGGVHNSAFNWNYRRNKLNLYGATAFNRGIAFENFRTFREFFELQPKNPEGTYFSWSHVQDWTNSYNIKLAADVDVSKQHLIGFALNGNWVNSTAKGGANSFVLTNEGKTEYLMESTIETPRSNDFNGNVNVNHKFVSTSKNLEWATDGTLLAFSGASVTNNQTLFFDTLRSQVLPPLLRRQTGDNRFTGYVFKSDVTLKDWLNWKWEAGYKFSFIETVSKPFFERQVGGRYVVDGGRTNQFIYSDRIHALYAMTTRSVGKTNIQLGLRLEEARGVGYQRLTDSAFTRRWTNLFPSISLQHQFSRAYQMILNYSRKIRRPTAGNLNPFTYFTDSLYSNSGNPFLQPHFSDNFELRQIIHSKYSLLVSYTSIGQMITMVVAHDPLYKTIRVRQYNFDRYRNLFVSATIPFSITKSWRVNLSATVGRNEASGVALQQNILESSRYFSFNISNVCTLSRSWSADLNTSYNSPQLSGLLIFTRPLLYSVGLRKSLKNNRGNIAFSSASPLYIPRFRFEADYANTAYSSRFTVAQQNYKLTLNWKFGKQSVPQQRTKRNAAEEEQNRM